MQEMWFLEPGECYFTVNVHLLLSEWTINRDLTVKLQSPWLFAVKGSVNLHLLINFWSCFYEYLRHTWFCEALLLHLDLKPAFIDCCSNWAHRTRTNVISRLLPSIKCPYFLMKLKHLMIEFWICIGKF